MHSAEETKQTEIHTEVPNSKASRGLTLKIGGNEFSLRKLGIFSLLFATVGTLVIFFTHAATSPLLTVEAENLTLSPEGAIISDAGASGGKAIVFNSTGVATGNFTLSAPANSITVRAYATQCKSTPQLVVTIDGQVTLSKDVPTSSWSDFTNIISIPAGNHSMSVAYTSKFTHGSCNRKLYLDAINFSSTMADPAPSIMLGASPQSVQAGGSSTLNWSSTNASSCTASGSWNGVQTPNGSFNTGVLSANTTYDLTCTGSGGSSNAKLTILVTPPSTGFVTRNGTQLLLDGAAYRFTGLNIYNANSRNNCWYTLGSGTGLDTALQDIGPGKKMIRAWFFQSLATSNGTRDWAAFDNTIAIAKSRGVKITATLGNQFASCEGWPSDSAGYKTEQWYSSDYRTRTGTPSWQPQAYRDYVRDVVARYKNEPTIAIWQLVNEAEDLNNGCNSTAATSLRNFADDVGGLIKSIDPNHLVSLGTIGTGQCGTQGDNYRLVHASPSIDLCEMHDYVQSQNIIGDSSNGMQLRIDQCNALGKPLFVGEVGINPNEVGGLAPRASRYKDKLSAQFAAGIVGFLAWNWENAGQSGGDQFAIQPNDPALSVLSH